MAKGESKSYVPSAVEKPLFDYWENAGHFKAQPKGPAKPFCMVIPPPNVTGALHLGHALNNTLQDILIRHKRMQGANTFWLVGTDHAGIATQATVEKTIRKTEGKSRHDLGRDELVRRIWDWKAKYGSRIVEQLKLMGSSCDYSRERFTLDEGCAKAVRETFFKLFRDGLIYRGKRLVNWDTELQTAVADDEVYHEAVKGHFYHLKYPIVAPASPNVAPASPPVSGEHGPPARANETPSARTGETPMRPDMPEFIHVATTRPETMLGDTAVAVHPLPDVALDKAEADLQEKFKTASEKDKADLAAQIESIAERRATILPTLLKLRDLAKAGATIRLPLTNRKIPLILDDWAKPELGSGCVKITPAHDANDYEVYKRHPEIGMINVLTADGKIADVVELDGSVNQASPAYAGLKFATLGREKVFKDLEAGGFVEKVEDRQIDIGHSDRSKSMIEPYLSDQWFVKMGDLTAEEASRISAGPFRDYLDGHRAAQKSPDSAGQSPSAASDGPTAAADGPSASRRSPMSDEITHFSSQKVEYSPQTMSDSGQNSEDSSQTSQDSQQKTQFSSQKRSDSSQNTTDSAHSGPAPERHGTAAERGGTAAERRGDAAERRGAAVTREGHGLAQFAIDAVSDSRVKFHPDRYAKTYIDWLAEKRDWCISRQLWWGHRIPVWSQRMTLREFEQLHATGLGGWLNEHGGLCEAIRAVRDNGVTYSWSSGASEADAVDADRLLKDAGLDEPLTWHRCFADPEPTVEFEGRTESIAHWLSQSGFVQDPDVLDTWFSSALWAHSTLGWPDATLSPDPSPDHQIANSPNPQAENLLATFYPTSVLSTAREIITLWVARMVMFGLYNLGKVPFKDVVIHPVIQDGQGRKMSKSLGNGVDPVDIIDKYGADALRFTLAELATETQDIRMPVTAEKQSDGREINVSTKFEKGRNFCNKLWQASMGFLLPNLEGHVARPLSREELRLEDRWILSRMTSCQKKLDEALARYRFSDVIGELYRFMWDDYCSSYLEMTKSRLAGEEGDTARQVLAFVLDRLLRLLHPVVPYVTEAIWQEFGRVAPGRGLFTIETAEHALISAKWPQMDDTLLDEAVEAEMARIQDVIRAGREIRTMVNEYRSQAKQPTIRALPTMIVTSDAATVNSFRSHADFVRSLAHSEALEIVESAPKPQGSLSRVIGPVTVHVPVADLIDLSLVRATEERRSRTCVSRPDRATNSSPTRALSRADPGVVEQARPARRRSEDADRSLAKAR
ncbi:MAG: valine--tRNA ligase [Planctomycetes bacterium]|nr:valine--tRNA ligase [Planctomycetota bacterium]